MSTSSRKQIKSKINQCLKGHILDIENMLAIPILKASFVLFFHKIPVIIFSLTA